MTVGLDTRWCMLVSGAQVLHSSVWSIPYMGYSGEGTVAEVVGEGRAELARVEDTDRSVAGAGIRVVVQRHRCRVRGGTPQALAVP